MDREEILDHNYDTDPRATLGVRPGGSRPGLPMPPRGFPGHGYGYGSGGGSYGGGGHERSSSLGQAGPSMGLPPGASDPAIPGSSGRPGRPQLKLQLTESHGSTTDSRPPSPKDTSPTRPPNRKTGPRVSLAIPPGGGGGGGDRSTSNATALSILTSSVNSNATETAGASGIKRRRRPTMRRKARASALQDDSREHEAQKMLGHLLDCLESRRKGPDILSRAAAAAKDTSAAQARRKRSVAQISKVVAAATVRTTAAAGKALTGGDDDDVDEDMAAAAEGTWDTDATYDLLEKTRSLFILADTKGFDLFSASGAAAADAASKAAKLAAKSKNRVGRFPSISGALANSTNNNTNDNTALSNVPGPTLLKRLAAVVQSLVATDCIHITTRFRLLKPPYALQTMVLDVAAYLYHKGDLEIKLMTMNAVIESLYTFGAPMRDRICQWLEGRMGELLRRLANERSPLDEDGHEKVDWSDPFAGDSPLESPSVPKFAFSAPDDSNTMSPASHKGWMRFSPAHTPTFHWPDKIVGVLSTHAAANVSTAAIQIASLVPRMLVAVTSTIDLTTSNLTTVHCVHRLISLILTAKPDAGLDLLEIIAHGPPVARRRGMDILATYYSKTVGHNVIARRPALTTYAAHRSKWETGQDRAFMEDDTEGHYYIPWRANPKTDKCVTCEQPCLGFGVRCTLCGDIKHFYCLKLLQQEVFVYTTTILATQETPSRAEMVSVRFSLVPPRPDELVINGGVTKGSSEATERKVGQHQLHLVNLFTLTLCDECKQPLWGTTAQAYACLNQCQRFFHPACVDAMSLYANPACQSGRQVYVNPEASEAEEVLDPFTTTAVDIHQSFLQFKNKLCYDPSKLTDMSYDEVSYLYANIWLQYEIYLNGISVGSLRLADIPLEDDITGIALLLNQYEMKLSRQLDPSPAMIDFANVSSEEIPDKGCLLWQVRYLQYCAALIRAPPDQSPDADQSNGGLLSVARPDSPDLSGTGEGPSVAYEQVPIRVVQQCLASDLHIRDDLAASTLIEQLRQLGLISIPNRRIMDAAAIDDKNMEITTPLPMLMDSSPAVELLVLAIEGLLEDIDLTSNEQALSLLVKLAWPTTMCSPYAMVRLGGAVMSWIMDEDDVLHNIVKTYASQRKRPPGVRNPPGITSAGGGSSAVAAYKDDRGRLLHRYARPWLEALCALDPQAYSDLAYERAKIIDNRYEALDLPKGAEAGAHMAGIALERITALADADVMFRGSLDLLTNWLEDLGGVLDHDVVFKQLPRLLRHANSYSFERNIWQEADMVSDESDEGFARVCRWLRALTFSGVVVPWDVIISLVDKHAVGRSADEALFNLVVAVDANTAPIEPAAFAQLCNNMFIPLAVSIGLRKDPPTGQEVEMLSISMLSLLKAYNTPAEAIVQTSLSSEGKAKVLAGHSRRRGSVSNNLNPTLIELQSEVVFAATRILPLKAGPANAVLDFLWLLFTKAAGADNVRGFLHNIAPQLYEILWQLYDRPEIDRRSRARLFLHLLTINNAPIQELVAKESKGKNERATRERLLEFVLELADEKIMSEVVGWRRASVGLITAFFDSALQPTEPNPETLVIWKSLLPAQLQAITACFEEYLESSPDEQRLQFIVKLLRLRANLPSWPIVGWGVIEQLVSEQLTNLLQFEGHDSVQAVAAVAEARNIRAAILSLGLHMLSSGVECEWAVLQRFQQHVAAACAQPWPDPADTVTGILLPALKTILDSTARTPVLDAGGRAKETTLVGALFVAVVINFASDLGKCDFVVQRCILDILLVVFFKHNVQPYELSALSTLQTLASFAAEPNSSENRLLALQVLRTAQARMPKDRFSRVLPPLFVGVADIMFKETKAEGDSAIIELCRELLQASIEEFGKAGLFLQVLHTDGQQSAGRSAPEAIGRAMQVAARLSGSKNKNVWLDQVILDLPDVLRWPRASMGHVFQSIARLSSTLEDGLSEDSALEFAAFLSRLSKHAAEWDAPEDINLNPILQTCTCLFRICPSAAEVTLLHSISTLLQVILPRYNIQLEQIKKLIPVSIAKARRQQTENTIAGVLFSGCQAAMKGLAVTGTSLRSLLDWLGDVEDPHLKPERLACIVEDSMGCAAILTRVHPTLATIRDAELTMGILKGAATVIVRAEIESQGNTGRILRHLPNEAAPTTLDVFAHILYASFDIRLGPSRSRLLSLYPVLGRATALSLSACADLLSIPDPHGEGAHIASSAFVIMRLAILAVNDPPPKEGGTFDESTVESQDVLMSFWHRLWPEWGRLLGLSLASSCINMPQRAVSLSVLMDVILFISANQPHLLVEPAPTLARGLATLEEWHHSAGTQVPAKLAKAEAALDAAALSSQPAANARRIAQRAVWADMLATERLLALRNGGGFD